MNAPVPPRTPALLGRGSWGEARRIADILRKETVGGALLLAAAGAAMIWVNSPWADAYEALRDLRVGPEALHLNLSLAGWAGSCRPRYAPSCSPWPWSTTWWPSSSSRCSTPSTWGR
ncbi:Na+/H+ antiporter NhaA [Streptosporangium sp. NPDC006930]|uniref:Na+/H+ antiporter NhaA n=1 Tax=unclassified Streptosporangium TaxID=2632669 RepID=UPI00341B656B